MRPRLENRLDEALNHRLVTVVADAGFGKSTLVGAWTARRHCAWHTVTADDRSVSALARGVADALRLRVPDLPQDLSTAVEGGRGTDADAAGRAEAFAVVVCEALAARLARDLVLVLDDLHELGREGPAVRLVEELCRHAPPALHLLLVGRDDPPFQIHRLRGQGQVLEVTGADLAFTVEEVGHLLADALDAEAASLAPALYRVTGGWPAALRLTVESVRGVPPAQRLAAVDAVRRPTGPVFSYLACEVFEREPPEVRSLIRVAATLDRFTAELCGALGVPDAVSTVASLARRGLFVEPERAQPGWFSLHALARDFALAHLGLDAAEIAALRRRAGEWFEAVAQPEEALRCLAGAGAHADIARVLTEQGPALLASGRVDAVLSAVEHLGPDWRDAGIQQLAGEALQVRGDWEGALACFERAGAGVEPLSTAIGWRMVAIHYLRGDLDEALKVFGRCQVEEAPPAEAALLLAWTASVHWARGEADVCRTVVAEALRLATASGDPRALAVAHTVAAMLAALTGDRAANDAHYLRALEHAERAGDILQVIRIRANHGGHLVEEGRYEEALAELDIAIQLAELAGFASFRALGIINRGEARFRLGRLEEAISDLETARTLCQRVGSTMLSYALGNLGDVYRERGDAALARAAYEEAIAQAEGSGDLQGLVPALSGLARVLVADDAVEAGHLAARALSYGEGMGYVPALLAAGWAALGRGDREAAARWATQAGAAARSRRDRAGLAESLELSVLAAPDPVAEVDRLHEAIAIWRDVHAPIGEARAQLSLARVLGRQGGRELAERVEATMRIHGARGHAAAARALIAVFDREARPPVSIESLGGFRVLRFGEPVAATEWQSKKARDLLKILVARRGRPVTREALMEALWPDDDPAKVANRLSVALATVRAVLDPARRFPSEHFVCGDKEAVALELAHVAVDVEAFLADAAAAFTLHARGRLSEARDHLVRAEGAYRGDFLEENPYDDWAVALREDARSTYVRVARLLALDAVEHGDHDGAARHLLRILERDRYDERAHLELVSTLVSAGRHGEARRCYRVYCSRMEEIGVESAPMPAPAGT